MTGAQEAAYARLKKDKKKRQVYLADTEPQMRVTWAEDGAFGPVTKEAIITPEGRVIEQSP